MVLGDVGSGRALFTLILYHYEFMLVFRPEDEEWQCPLYHTLRRDLQQHDLAGVPKWCG